jgi:predicted transcriptional regulator
MSVITYVKRNNSVIYNKRNNIEDGSTYYYMSQFDYNALKKLLENFLLGAGMHNIEHITENTTGYGSKAYFNQRALDDLVNQGIIIKVDIGYNPEKNMDASQANYIYQHKQSQRPMKSTEMDID